MAQSFPETAHLNTDLKKYRDNYDGIDWKKGNKSMKYRKKPVVIEAFKLERRELNWPQWAHDALTENTIISHNTGKWFNPSEETYLIIKTLEGDHKACLGDYVIRGVKGDIYPCKPDIFEMTYDAV